MRWACLFSHIFRSRTYIMPPSKTSLGPFSDPSKSYPVVEYHVLPPTKTYRPVPYRPVLHQNLQVVILRRTLPESLLAPDLKCPQLLTPSYPFLHLLGNNQISKMQALESYSTQDLFQSDSNSIFLIHSAVKLLVLRHSIVLTTAVFRKCWL